GARKPPDIVQYLPCVVRPQRAEARHLAKQAIGAMLATFWPAGSDWPVLRETIVAHSRVPKPELVDAPARLRRSADAAPVLDDRLVAALALAGTAEDCLAQMARYRGVGVDELALSFAGDQPETDMAYLMAAAAVSQR